MPDRGSAILARASTRASLQCACDRDRADTTDTFPDFNRNAVLWRARAFV
jgi:hypothetical protein